MLLTLYMEVRSYLLYNLTWVNFLLMFPNMKCSADGQYIVVQWRTWQCSSLELLSQTILTTLSYIVIYTYLKIYKEILNNVVDSLYGSKKLSSIQFDLSEFLIDVSQYEMFCWWSIHCGAVKDMTV